MEKFGGGSEFSAFTWSCGQGQNGHFRFRERGHCSLYINKIFIL